MTLSRVILIIEINIELTLIIVIYNNDSNNSINAHKNIANYGESKDGIWHDDNSPLRCRWVNSSFANDTILRKYFK